MSQQTLSASAQSSIIVLETGDSLDERSVEPLMNRIRTLVSEGLDVLVFDCSELEYISSFGLSVLLRARKFLREAHGEARPNGTAKNANGSTNGSRSILAGSGGEPAERVRLVNVSRHVRDILRTAHLVQILPVFESVQAARQPTIG